MHATSTDSLVVDRVHCGPPESGNGDGPAVARGIPVPGAGDGVTVRPSSPPPLDAPMTVTLADGVATLTHAGHLVATARPGIVAPLKTDAVDLAAAADAETRYEALASHPFSTCFSCGTDRDPEEALPAARPLADGSGGMPRAGPRRPRLAGVGGTGLPRRLVGRDRGTPDGAG